METPTKPFVGPGARVLLSPGAEAFDPDSMVEEPTPPSPPTKPAFAATLTTLALRLPESQEEVEPFQVVGFLKAIKAKNGVLDILFECLVLIGLDLCELTLASKPSKFVSCAFHVGGEESASHSWEFPGWNLVHAAISEVQGAKALVELQFLRAEEEEG